MSAALSIDEAGWYPRDAEADLLAASLRSSRITLLSGPAGAGRTALLQAGVLPLLRRRAGDGGVPIGRPAAGALPFPDRRGRAAPSPWGGAAETAVLFDAWGRAPLAALLERLQATLSLPQALQSRPWSALADSLVAWGAQRDTRFLLIFDRFEDFLLAPPERSDLRAFAEAFVHAANDAAVPANFLLSLRDEAEPALARLSGRIAGFDRQHVRLAPLRGGVLLPSFDAPPKRWRPSPPVANELSGPDPAEPAAPDVAPDEAGLPIAIRPPAVPTHDASAALLMAPQAVAVVPRRRRSARSDERRRPPSTGTVIVVTAAIASLGLVWWLQSPAEPALAELVTAPSLPAVTPPAAAAPSVLSLTVAAVPAAPSPIADLVGRVAPAASVELRTRPSAGWREDLAMLAETPGLAITRYGVLQAARQLPAPPALQVVAPLYVEPLRVLVRADSPWRFVHEIEGRRLAVGRADGALALTAATLHGRLFGRALPPDRAVELEGDEALRELLDGGRTTIDAVLTVGPEPLHGVLPERRRELRTLELDPAHPASRRALQAFLPVGPAAGDTDRPGLGELAFLVTAERGDAGGRDAAALVQALCRSLPQLQSEGHRQWRELRAGLQLEVGWPYAGAAAEAWAGCSPAKHP